MDRVTLVNGFRLNLDYTMQLVEDVKENEMTAQPNGFTNHPAFTLGHLVTATALSQKVMGKKYVVPTGWDELFRRRGPGDPTLPEKDASRYPAKEALIEEIKTKSTELIGLINEAEDAYFEEPYEWKLDHYMPTVGQVMYFQCFLHHGWHIGQLAEWRRLMGYDSALRRLINSDHKHD